MSSEAEGASLEEISGYLRSCHEEGPIGIVSKSDILRTEYNATRRRGRRQGVCG